MTTKILIHLTLVFISSTLSVHVRAEVTGKIQRIVNAVDMVGFSTEEEFSKMLATACENNSCSAVEAKEIQTVGNKIILCKMDQLKAEGIVNKDAKIICESQQAMFGCDSLPNSLLRKMCYSGNSYSLKTWKDKESKMKSRAPASR